MLGLSQGILATDVDGKQVILKVLKIFELEASVSAIWYHIALIIHKTL